MHSIRSIVLDKTRVVQLTTSAALAVAGYAYVAERKDVIQVRSVSDNPYGTGKIIETINGTKYKFKRARGLAQDDVLKPGAAYVITYHGWHLDPVMIPRIKSATPLANGPFIERAAGVWHVSMPSAASAQRMMR